MDTFQRYARRPRHALLATLSASLLLTACLGGGGSGGSGGSGGGSNDNGAVDTNEIAIATRAYNQQVEVTWQSQGDHSYTLYWSEERDFDLETHASSSGAGSALGVTSPYRVEGLENRRNWYFRVEADDGTVSPVRGALPGPPTVSGNISVQGGLIEAGDHLFVGSRQTGGGILNQAAMLVQRDTGFAAEGTGISGVIRKIVADGDDGFFLGGRMRIGDTEDLGVVRLTADLDVDPDWQIASDGGFENVRTIAVDEDRVYVGGFFTELGGVQQPYLAALSRDDGTVDTTFDPLLDAMVWDIALLGDRVMIAGQFTTVSNDPDGERFAVLNRDGSLINPQPETNVNFSNEFASSLAVFNGAVLVSGTFTDAGSNGDIDNLLRITADGEVSAVDITPGGGRIGGIASSGTHLAVVGDFSEINGEPRNLLAVFDTDLELLPGNPFSQDASVSPFPHNWDVVRMRGDRVYLNAVRDPHNGITGGLAEVDLATGLTSFKIAPSSGGALADVLPYGDDLLLVAGGDGIANAFREPALLALDRDGNFSEQFRMEIENDQHDIIDVRDLAVDTSDRLYATGQFTGVGEIKRNGAFRLDPDGRISNRWAPNLGDDTYRDLAAVTMSDGQEVSGFAPSLNNQVRTMAYWDDYVIAGGPFSRANGEDRDGLALFDVSDGSLIDWQPSSVPDDATVHQVSSGGSQGFLVGGAFDSLDQDPQLSNLAFYQPTQGGGFEPVPDWRPAPDGTVFAITRIGDTIWVGGGFDNIDGQEQSLIAPLHAQTGELDTARAPDVEGTNIYHIAAFGDLVCFTGRFTRVAGQAFRDVACVDGDTGVPAW